jgi:hypothetical protein
MAEAARYYVRAPVAGINNGEQFSDLTANVDLSTLSWAATEDTNLPQHYRCPRAFVANFSGTLAFTALQSSAATPMYVIQGKEYPIAIRAITKASSSAALQVADAVTLLY